MTLVVRMKFGSHLYGTNTPQSDEDFKSVFIPSARDILLQSIKGTVSTNRPKQDGEKNHAGEIDEESYALHRFMQLCAEGQTSAMDMLFAPDSAILETSKCWRQIRSNRHKLLTKKSTAFVGYCRTQANKYGVRGDRVAAARAAMEFFRTWSIYKGEAAKVSELSGGDFVTSMERLLVDRHPGICRIVELPTKGVDGAMLKHFECCNKKIPFTNTLKDAYGLYWRIFTDYGHRAKQAETNKGVDWKALSHAVRIAEEAIELLNTGKITLPLRNVQHILDIKQGRLTYQDVATEIDDLLIKVEEAAETSILPEKVNKGWIDEFVADWHYASVIGDWK